MIPNHVAVAIWSPAPQAGFERVPLAGCMCLDAGGNIAALGSLPIQVSGLVVQPVRAPTGEIGIGIVPDDRCGPTALNGTPLRAGLHMLNQGDFLDVGPTRYWVSAEFVAEEAIYDPLVHGQDIHCYLTKARVVAGQPVTICPGTATTRCGVLYKTDAWNMAMLQSNPPMSCTCGYSPGAAPWSPPAPNIRHKNLDDLYRHALDTTN